MHFAPADNTTLRLVDRVSKVKWIEEAQSPTVGSGEAEVARRFLGISLSRSQTASSVSVSDVAAVKEKPGVQTPSRSGESGEAGAADEGLTMATRPKKPLPEVPKHRHGVPFAQKFVNGGQKKTPPKAPPPRRWGRMKTVEKPPADPVKEPAQEQEAA